MASIRFLGHAGFEVEAHGRTVIFNPFLNPRPAFAQRLVPPALSPHDIRRADFVMLTDSAPDHCDPLDVAAIVARTNATVLAPESVLEKLEVNPRLKMQAYAGDSFTMHGLDVDVTGANIRMAPDGVGYVLNDGAQRVYYAGPTHDFYGMSQLNAPEIAILPIGGTSTMDMFSSIKAIKYLRPRVVIPMHYGTFAKINVNPHEWAKHVKNDTKAEPIVIEVGESVSV
ncbi:Beta-lactamase superfamily domain protein [uncultured archaeon]|nr:Beta-lactamase superfamily domain protein [uncultured archaeon]